jgi:hypothetical protein
MKTTSMPGFTAERSLDASTGSYRSTAARQRRSGASVEPAQFCPPIRQQCSECIPTGPAIFSRGRQFCQTFTCRQTISGGCSCRLLSKGFVGCLPYGLGNVGGVFF